MKAIVQDRYGPPEVLELRDVPKPVAGPRELLVRVHAASVNARDWHIMRGDPYIVRLMTPSLFGFSGPKMKIRGSDFAGRIEAVGSGVTRFAVPAMRCTVTSAILTARLPNTYPFPKIWWRRSPRT